MADHMGNVMAHALDAAVKINEAREHNEHGVGNVMVREALHQALHAALVVVEEARQHLGENPPKPQKETGP